MLFNRSAHSAGPVPGPAKGPTAQRPIGSTAQGLRGSRAQGLKGSRAKGARNEAQRGPRSSPRSTKSRPRGGAGAGPAFRPSGLGSTRFFGGAVWGGALSRARSTTRILRFGGGSGLPRQASLGRNPRLESCDLGHAQIALSSLGLRCRRHKMRNPPRPNTTFSDLAGALQ